MCDPSKRQDGLEYYLVESALGAGWYNQYPLQPLRCMKTSEFGAERSLVGQYVSCGFFWVFLGSRLILLLTEVRQAVFGSAKVLLYLLQLCLGDARARSLPALVKVPLTCLRKGLDLCH